MGEEKLGPNEERKKWIETLRKGGFTDEDEQLYRHILETLENED